MSQELPIEYGGTSASTAVDALSNLGGLSVSDALAPNIIKASRPVIEGRTGDALPVFGVDTVYADGAEIAFGLFTDGSVTLQLDANENIIRTGGAGTLYTEIDIASGLSLTDYYYSIMYNDGSGFVQIYGDGTNGITLSEPVAGTARLDMDLNTLTDGIAVYGISEQLGRLPVLSDDDVRKGLWITIAELLPGWGNGTVLTFDDISCDDEIMITGYAISSNRQFSVVVKMENFLAFNEIQVAYARDTDVSGNYAEVYLGSITPTSCTVVTGVTGSWSAAVTGLYKRVN